MKRPFDSATLASVTPAQSTPPQATRRDVLKLGGAAAAGSLLTGTSIPHVHAAEDNTIRLALIGCGGRGRGAVGNAFAAAKGPVKLHAVADLHRGAAFGTKGILERHFGDRVDVPTDRHFVGFDAYRHAIDTLRPGDVAMVTAYAYCRPLHVEYAVKKGVNVFMEKSFAADPVSCQRIIAAGEEAKKKNVKIAAGLQCRHSVARQALIEKVRAGELGEITEVHATRGFGGNYLAKPPANTDHVAWQIRQRLFFLWASAGFLSEMLIHQIDECCWIKDAWPVSATATGVASNRPNNCSQNLNNYDIEYTFADGGKAIVQSVAPFATFIHGTKRNAQFSGNVHRATVHTYRGKKMTKDEIDWAADPEPCNPWQAEWADLLHAIREDKPYNEAERAIKANLATIMGRAAAHLDRKVTWDEVTSSDFTFAPGVDELSLGGNAPVQPDADGNYPRPLTEGWNEV
jgi:predicted dehydrogenase